MTLQRSDYKETSRVDVEDRDKPMDKHTETHLDVLRQRVKGRGGRKSLKFNTQDRIGT